MNIYDDRARGNSCCMHVAVSVYVYNEMQLSTEM